MGDDAFVKGLSPEQTEGKGQLGYVFYTERRLWDGVIREGRIRFSRDTEGFLILRLEEFTHNFRI